MQGMEKGRDTFMCFSLGMDHRSSSMDGLLCERAGVEDGKVSRREDCRMWVAPGQRQH